MKNLFMFCLLTIVFFSTMYLTGDITVVDDPSCPLGKAYVIVKNGITTQTCVAVF